MISSGRLSRHAVFFQRPSLPCGSLWAKCSNDLLNGKDLNGHVSFQWSDIQIVVRPKKQNT